MKPEIKKLKVDKIFLILTGILLSVGIGVFLSASLSLLSVNPDKFKNILFNQLVLGLVGGIVLVVVTMQFSYKELRPWGYVIGIIALCITVMVFVPGIGFSHGGATRWLNLGPLSFQPVELLKYCIVIAYAAWLSIHHKKMSDYRFGLLPFLIIIGVTGAVLLAQPDTDNFMIIAAACMCMYFIAGARWRDIGVTVLLGVVGIVGIVMMRPYVLERIKVFIDPTIDPLGSSYQVQQQLIAIGSGKITGRGFGQGIQKFKYLPEPLGDSIYAVASEEWGMVGSVTIIVLYLLFALRGIFIALRTEDMFGRFLVFGIMVVIIGQSFLHIASSIAVFPLSGLPLVFISHGGTSLALSLCAIGLVFNISRYMKNE